MSEEQGPTWISMNRDHRVVRLSKPVRQDGMDLVEIRLREPIVRDFEDCAMEEYDKPAAFLRHVLAKCSGFSPTTIGQLTLSDFQACGVALSDMGFSLEHAYGFLRQQLPSSLPSGPTGSEPSKPASTSENPSG